VSGASLRDIPLAGEALRRGGGKEVEFKLRLDREVARTHELGTL